LAETTQPKIESMKNKIFLIIQSLGLLFFGLNIYFDFITFESSKVNPFSIVIICVISLLFNLKKEKSGI
jgi:hypothetical protein